MGWLDISCLIYIAIYREQQFHQCLKRKWLCKQFKSVHSFRSGNLIKRDKYWGRNMLVFECHLSEWKKYITIIFSPFTQYTYIDQCLLSVHMKIIINVNKYVWNINYISVLANIFSTVPAFHIVENLRDGSSSSFQSNVALIMTKLPLVENPRGSLTVYLLQYCFRNNTKPGYPYNTQVYIIIVITPGVKPECPSKRVIWYIHLLFTMHPRYLGNS